MLAGRELESSYVRLLVCEVHVRVGPMSIKRTAVKP